MSLIYFAMNVNGISRQWAVADPGFDLRGGVDFVHGRGIKSVFNVFLPYFY